MKFYTNKYPIVSPNWFDGNGAPIPSGTVFKISGIYGDGYELEPVNGEKYNISASVGILSGGFAETDFITGKTG